MEQPILNTMIFQQRENPTQQKVVWPGNGASFRPHEQQVISQELLQLADAASLEGR